MPRGWAWGFYSDWKSLPFNWRILDHLHLMWSLMQLCSHPSSCYYFLFVPSIFLFLFPYFYALLFINLVLFMMWFYLLCCLFSGNSSFCYFGGCFTAYCVHLKLTTIYFQWLPHYFMCSINIKIWQYFYCQNIFPYFYSTSPLFAPDTSYFLHMLQTPHCIAITFAISLVIF